MTANPIIIPVARCGMTTKSLGDTISLYLTTVEDLKRAAQTFDKDVEKRWSCFFDQLAAG